MVDTVSAYIADAKPDVTKDDICHDLARNYLRAKADVDVDTKVDSFDMALDLLYNLQQASENMLPAAPEAKEADSAAEESAAEEAAPEEKEEAPQEPPKPVIKEKSPELIQAEQLFSNCKYVDAYGIFQKLAKNGDSRAMYYLGEYLGHPYPNSIVRQGIGILFNGNMRYIRDDKQAATWWSKGKDAGDALAALKAADSDKEKAFQKVLFLAEQGDVAAQFEVGRCYDHAIGTAQDYGKAVEWYSKAAMKGDARAQNNLGNSYYSGHGVAEDDEMAVVWYRKAAEQGCPQAQYNLGNCYSNCEGIEPDDDEDTDETAAEWYESAANQGNVEAQFQIGECYYYGTGVEENSFEAKEWFEKAAKQGHAKATNALNNYYFDDDDDDD